MPNLPPRYRLPLLVLGLLALASGVGGGLLRLGVSTPAPATAISQHGALMVAAFFGTVISLERAVALAAAPWYIAPLCAGLGGVALLVGERVPAPLAPALFCLAALIFCAGSVRIWQRQRALFTFTLLLGAGNWLLGNVAWWLGAIDLAVALWINFLLLTIAGERLELTRLRPPQPTARRLFVALLIALHLGLPLEVPFSLGVLGMALWLLRYDIAWTMVRGDGLPRFVAICLLAGYAQLAFAALLGLDGALLTGHPWRDAALHAVFLGFVFSMVIGHAPIIFPAVMRVKIPWHPVFYLPLLALHASVLARVAGVLCDNLALRQHGALGNAVALGLLIVTLLSRVLAGSGFFAHALWKAGFRSMFALGMIAGAVLPTLWVIQFSTIAVSPALTFRHLMPPMHWHAHEMFFGFGAAVLGGFLLTASKNWVAIRGYHGGALATLAAAWLLDRLAINAGASWPPALFWLATSLYTAGFVAMVCATLIRHRANDSYRSDNGYFLLALPLLLPAKWLLLQPEHFTAGTAMTLAIFRLAFLLMLERTLTQFMNSNFKLTLPRHVWLDHAIKSLALLLVFSPWLPEALTTLASISCATLLLARTSLWHAHKALPRIELAVMFAGKLAIAGQLLLPAQTHLFTLGTLGLIIPAMLVRISKGHTGRKVAFDALDKAVLWAMLAALAVRTALPVALPPSYHLALWLSAGLWLAAFGTLAVRYLPFLFQERADGREH